jgi:hypothetical protein
MRFLVLALLFALVAVVSASPVLGDGEGKGRKWLEKLCKESPDQLAKMVNDPKGACVQPFSIQFQLNAHSFCSRQVAHNQRYVTPTVEDLFYI